MTKEQELLYKIVETWGNAAISFPEREQWLKDYAMRQAIAFAIHYCEGKITWINTTPPENDRMEERYKHFIESQQTNNQ